MKNLFLCILLLVIIKLYSGGALIKQWEAEPDTRWENNSHRHINGVSFLEKGTDKWVRVYGTVIIEQSKRRR